MIRGPEIRTKQSVIRREPETNYARTAQTAENLTRTRSMADGSIDPLLQFITEHGQMLGVAIACGCFWRFFILSIYCPFQTENWLYSVEQIEAGETVDSKSRQ